MPNFNPALLTAISLLTAALAVGQNAAPVFEAASVKASDAGPGSSGIETNQGLLRGHNVTLRRCISGAWGVPEAQILGGPKWLDELRFEIVARADHAAGDRELMPMLKTLLADRFKLAVHQDSRALSGYALTVLKGGLKARPSAPDDGGRTNTGRGVIEASGCPMSRLAMKLSAVLGQPVVDMTDVAGKFDFKLEWTPDEMLSKPGASTDLTQKPSLFTAIQEQLGLRLESRKVPTDVLIIDRAETPSDY